MPAGYTLEATVGTELEFASLPGLWLESTYDDGNWLFSGGTREGQILSFKQVWAELVPGVPLPYDLDVRIWNAEVSFSIDSNSEADRRNYKLEFSAAASASLRPMADLESKLQVERISFTYHKRNDGEAGTEIALRLRGNAFVHDDLQVTDFALDFQYEYLAAKARADWSVKGNLSVLAFQRRLRFAAAAASLETTQTLSFRAEQDAPALYASYFNRIDGTTGKAVLQALNGGTAPEGGVLLLAALPADIRSVLGDAFSDAQKEAIQQVVEQARRNQEPLLVIPDVLNGNKPLCEIQPRLFQLKLVREDGRFKQLDFAIGADLVLYNTWNNGSELFRIRNGVLASGYAPETSEFYLTYRSEETVLRPLNVVSLLPGMQEALMPAFGETTDAHPKTTAFAEMLELRPLDFTFRKKGRDWDLGGGIRLVLTEALKTVDANLYGFLEKVFPHKGEARYLDGRLGYNSTDGLLFILENNNGLEIPNLFGAVAAALDASFKSEFRQKTGIDLDAALDLGPSFLILDRVRIQLASEARLDLRLGIGLPANLNDRLFNRASKIHGLIRTYDRAKFEQAGAVPKETVAYDAPLPDDNLIRFSLRLGSDGISGQLDQFNLFNPEKLSEEFVGLVSETSDAVVLNLTALTNQSGKDYGRLKFEKPTLKLDFKTCAFHIAGGVQLLSESLRVPVRPFLKKLIALLPTDKFDLGALNAVADRFTDSIDLKSLDFYDAGQDRLSINALLDFLRQFLPEDQRHVEILPQAFVDLINEHAGAVGRVLPRMLLEYLNLKIPAGIRFDLEVTADQSVALSLEVPEPTEAQRAAGYTDYLQVLMPNPMTLNMQALRVKKIGLGSGLFNQAIRLDLSAEMAMINVVELLAGIPLAALRNAHPGDRRLQHMVPDARAFGYRYQADNLLMLIFMQAGIPIPVPVFYDKLAVYAAGLSGAKAELDIRFPRPRVNVVELFKSMGNLVQFFREPDFALPVTGYGVARKGGEALPTGLIPQFSAGPVYAELPGILGYQKFPDGSRGPVRLGTKDQILLSGSDLFAVAANSLKFMLRSILEKERRRIPINEHRSEYPVNYLVQFLPETQRIGRADVVLLDLFEANLAWAFSTPSEFRERVLPLLHDEPGDTGPGWTADQVLALVPNTQQRTDAEGVIVCLKGGVRIGEHIIIDAVTATAITDSGFATGLALRTKVAGLFDFDLSGGVVINLASVDQQFGLRGDVSLRVLGGVPVLKGTFRLGVGEQSRLEMTGMLDLFPDELFPGGRSPIQLYTGPQRGIKDAATGIVSRDGIVVGSLQEDGTVAPAGVHLEIGTFYLGGATRLVSTADHHEWELRLVCHNTELHARSQSYRVDGGSILEFGFSVNQAINIGNLISLSGVDGATGPSGSLALLYRDGSQYPELRGCHFSGWLSLLGFSARAQVIIEPDRFTAEVAAGLGILDGRLYLSGNSFSDTATFNLSATLNLLNCLARLDIQTKYATSLLGGTTFEGDGALTFLGNRVVTLTVKAGVYNGLPLFEASGQLNLPLIDDYVELYSGNAQGRLPMTGIISQDGADFGGGLVFRLGELRASGELRLRIRDFGLDFGGSLHFDIGFLAGCTLTVAASKAGDIFSMAGSMQGALRLIPDLLELHADSSFNFRLNEAYREVELCQFQGNVNLWGITSRYDLTLRGNSVQFRTQTSLPLLDLSLSGRSDNLSDVSTWLFSGSVSLQKLNEAIDAFLNAIGLWSKVSDRISAAENNYGHLHGMQQNAQERQQKLGFIQWLDSYFGGNGWDPDGFQYCVPPVGHIAYWSDSRWQWDWGKPRYSKEELGWVEQYWRYKAELGMPTNEPNRHDIGRFLNGIANDLNNKFYEIGHEISNTFRHVVNEIHRFVSDDILRHLNIDTTDLNTLNDAFNQGLTTLDQVARDWRDFNAALLNNKPLEIYDLTYTDQPIDVLRSRRFAAKVRYAVIGQPGEANIYLDLDDPGGSLVRNLKEFMPDKLKMLV